jgi:hypothetical protein
LKKYRLPVKGKTLGLCTIKQLRGGHTQRANLIKDGNENLLVEPDPIAARWREYFTDLLNNVEEGDILPSSSVNRRR